MTELPQSSDFPSNTKTKEKRVEKVIKSKPVARKRSFIRTLFGSFIADDVEDIRSYILLDVVVPAIKDTILDAAIGGLDRLFYGESRHKRRGSILDSRPSKYTVYSNKSKQHTKRAVSSRARATHDFREIVLEERGEAELVIDRLTDLIEDYEIATVSDLYALVDISASYTDDKWGWTSPEGFEIRRVREGYLLDLPRPMPVE